MRVVILCGGYGSRLSEETHLIPKPLVTVGDRPILWHIMKHYSRYGYDEFVILLGYKGWSIKEYFLNFNSSNSDICVDLQSGGVTFRSAPQENWKVHLIDTGLGTLTGGRVLRVRELLGGSPFLLTYGDGVSDINLNDLVKFHQERGGVMTMSSVKPFGRFGTFQEGENGRVARFSEKPKGDGASINGGFFVCEPELFNYLVDGDLTILEKGPMETLALEGRLFFYDHQGFWKCMDTLKDKQELNDIYASGNAPWVTWED